MANSFVEYYTKTYSAFFDALFSKESSTKDFPWEEIFLIMREKLKNGWESLEGTVPLSSSSKQQQQFLQQISDRLGLSLERCLHIFNLYIYKESPEKFSYDKEYFVERVIDFYFDEQNCAIDSITLMFIFAIILDTAEIEYGKQMDMEKGKSKDAHREDMIAQFASIPLVEIQKYKYARETVKWLLQQNIHKTLFNLYETYSATDDSNIDEHILLKHVRLNDISSEKATTNISTPSSTSSSGVNKDDLWKQRRHHSVKAMQLIKGQLNEKMLNIQASLLDCLFVIYYHYETCSAQEFDKLLRRFIEVDFGNIYRNIPYVTAKAQVTISRIISISLLLCIEMLYLDDSQGERKTIEDDSEMNYEYFDQLFSSINGSEAYHGALLLSWSAFLKLKIYDPKYRSQLVLSPDQEQDKLRVHSIINEHTLQGLKCNGLDFFRVMFDPDGSTQGDSSYHNFPFIGHEMCLSAYKMITKNAIGGIISLFSIPKLPFSLIDTIICVIENLLTRSKHEMDDTTRIAFLDDVFNNTTTVLSHNFKALFFYLKNLFPSRTFYLRFLAALVYDQYSANIAFQIVEDQETYCLDITNEEVEQYCGFYGESDQQVVLTRAYRHHTTGFTIPRNTPCSLLRNHQNRHHLRAQFKSSGWKILLGQIYQTVKQKINFVKSAPNFSVVSTGLSPSSSLSSQTLHEDSKGPSSPIFHLGSYPNSSITGTSSMMYNKFDTTMTNNVTSGSSSFQQGSYNTNVGIPEDPAIVVENIYSFFNILYKVITYATTHGDDNEQAIETKIHLFDKFVKDMGIPIQSYASKNGGGILYLIQYVLTYFCSLGSENIPLRLIASACKCFSAFAAILPVPTGQKLSELISQLHFMQILRCECSQGRFDATMSLLDTLYILCCIHPISIKPIYQMIPFICSNIFAVHDGWRYQKLEQRWLIGLKCLQIFNRVSMDSFWSYDTTKTFDIKTAQKTKFESNNQLSQDTSGGIALMYAFLRDATLYQNLFSLIGLGGAFLERVIRYEKTEEAAIVEELIAQSLLYLETLLKYRISSSLQRSKKEQSDKSHHHLTPFEETLISRLIGKKQVPLVTAIFEFVDHPYSEIIRVIACRCITLIARLTEQYYPRPPSLVGYLGSEATLLVSRCLFRIQKTGESELLRIAIFELIAIIIENQRGLAELFLSISPKVDWQKRENDSKLPRSNSSSSLFLDTTTMRDQIPAKGCIATIKQILHDSTIYIKLGQSALIRSCLSVLHSIVQSGDHAHIVRHLRKDEAFWEDLLKILEFCCSSQIEAEGGETSYDPSKDIHLIRSVSHIVSILSIDLYNVSILQQNRKRMKQMMMERQRKILLERQKKSKQEQRGGFSFAQGATHETQQQNGQENESEDEYEIHWDEKGEEEEESVKETILEILYSSYGNIICKIVGHSIYFVMNALNKDVNLIMKLQSESEKIALNSALLDGEKNNHETFHLRNYLIDMPVIGSLVSSAAGIGNGLTLSSYLHDAQQAAFSIHHALHHHQPHLQHHHQDTLPLSETEQYYDIYRIRRWIGLHSHGRTIVRLSEQVNQEFCLMDGYLSLLTCIDSLLTVSVVLSNMEKSPSNSIQFKNLIRIFLDLLLNGMRVKEDNESEWENKVPKKQRISSEGEKDGAISVRLPLPPLLDRLVTHLHYQLSSMLLTVVRGMIKVESQVTAAQMLQLIQHLGVQVQRKKPSICKEIIGCLLQCYSHSTNDDEASDDINRSGPANFSQITNIPRDQVNMLLPILISCIKTFGDYSECSRLAVCALSFCIQSYSRDDHTTFICTHLPEVVNNFFYQEQAISIPQHQHGKMMGDLENSISNEQLGGSSNLETDQEMSEADVVGRTNDQKDIPESRSIGSKIGLNSMYREHDQDWMRLKKIQQKENLREQFCHPISTTPHLSSLWTSNEKQNNLNAPQISSDYVISIMNLLIVLSFTEEGIHAIASYGVIQKLTNIPLLSSGGPNSKVHNQIYCEGERSSWHIIWCLCLKLLNSLLQHYHNGRTRMNIAPSKRKNQSIGGNHTSSKWMNVSNSRDMLQLIIPQCFEFCSAHQHRFRYAFLNLVEKRPLTLAAISEVEHCAILMHCLCKVSLSTSKWTNGYEMEKQLPDLIEPMIRALNSLIFIAENYKDTVLKGTPMTAKEREIYQLENFVSHEEDTLSTGSTSLDTLSSTISHTTSGGTQQQSEYDQFGSLLGSVSPQMIPSQDIFDTTPNEASGQFMANVSGNIVEGRDDLSWLTQIDLCVFSSLRGLLSAVRCLSRIPTEESIEYSNNIQYVFSLQHQYHILSNIRRVIDICIHKLKIMKGTISKLATRTVYEPSTAMTSLTTKTITEEQEEPLSENTRASLALLCKILLGSMNESLHITITHLFIYLYQFKQQAQKPKELNDFITQVQQTLERCVPTFRSLKNYYKKIVDKDVKTVYDSFNSIQSKLQQFLAEYSTAHVPPSRVTGTPLTHQQFISPRSQYHSSVVSPNQSSLSSTSTFYSSPTPEYGIHSASMRTPTSKMIPFTSSPFSPSNH